MRRKLVVNHYAFVDAYIGASALFRTGKLYASFSDDCFRPPRPHTGFVEDRAPP
jgi:hypothetical protein